MHGNKINEAFYQICEIYSPWVNCSDRRAGLYGRIKLKKFGDNSQKSEKIWISVKTPKLIFKCKNDIL